MNIPTSPKEALDKMREIVRADRFDSRDVQPIRDLIALAQHSAYREGMGKRRRLLENHLLALDRLKQQATIDNHWLEIHSLVSDFNSEIGD